jgi:hypothetical protein
VQVLTEANVDRVVVAVEASADGGLTDRVAQLLGRDIDAGRGGAILGVSGPAISCNEEVFGSSPKAGLHTLIIKRLVSTA